jgi:probable F420-dependent oxidoreductase
VVELAVHIWERDPKALAEAATRAEELGFASISIGDHVSPGLLSPFMACAVIASATSRIQFGPLVLNNDLRHPVLVAQQAAGLSRWSGGRFELAMGSGYNRREYSWLGIPFAPRDVRAARLGESLTIIRALLAGEVVSFEGQHYSVHEANLGDAPPRVPILVGGNSDAVLRVAAEHGDIVTLAGYSPGTSSNSYAPDVVAEKSTFLAANRPSEAGPLGIHVLVQHHEITNDRAAAIARAAIELETTEDIAAESPFVLAGTSEEIAAQMRKQHSSLNISRWTVFGDRPGHDPASAFAPVLHLLAAAS